MPHYKLIIMVFMFCRVSPYSSTSSVYKQLSSTDDVVSLPVANITPSPPPQYYCNTVHVIICDVTDTMSFLPSGLCGNADGNTQNDYRTRFGRDVSRQPLKSRFWSLGNSWRVVSTDDLPQSRPRRSVMYFRHVIPILICLQLHTVEDNDIYVVYLLVKWINAYS